MKLLFEALIKFAAGVVLIVALIFLPAGTVHYPGGLLLAAVLFVPMFFAGLVMLVKKPELLKKRLNNKEKQSEQKTVVAVSAIMFICGFITAGISFRLNFLMMPEWVSYVGAVILLFSYIIYGEVLRENQYLSRTVEVQEGQRVISTGLYGIVRHPMYGATVFLFLSMPLVLGSALSLVIFLVYPLLIAKRIRNEEKVLEEGLAGYDEYKKKVKYKMIPYIW